MKRLFTAIAALVTATAVQASTFATDATDLWWNPNEGGWGINVIQQYDTLFVTFFVYGQNGLPVWYGATNMAFSGSSGSQISYSGQLHQTNGPWFGGAFNPNLVSSRQVGNATFTLTSISTATLTYSIDGVTVTKSLARYTFKTNNLVGSYFGSIIGSQFNCTNPANNVPVNAYASIGIGQNPSAFALDYTDASTGAGCTFVGPYAQFGKLGAVAGTFSCSSGRSGTFQMVEIEANPNSFSARLTYIYSLCSWSGRVSGTNARF